MAHQQIAHNLSRMRDLVVTRKRGTFGRVFEEDPNIEHMFRGARKEQEHQLAQMLETIVAGLARSGELLPALRALGLRHVRYGVRVEDYRAFGSALAWTLERYLGDEVDPETLEAWDQFYIFVTRAMQRDKDWTISSSFPNDGRRRA